MNAYFIHSGTWLDYCGQPSDLTCDIVIAPTRGRAKSLFFNKYRNYMDDYTAIKLCRTIAKNVDLEEGCVGDKVGEKYDQLWEMIPIGWGE